ncbi:ParB N-terminal domain-containing protein [Azorhizobium doebereinerae]|uniref:ParB N-terminal domain-containing protein n=1 Tax=Azorhizobium doebereinerae TaxID=281091 RepID=UPI00041BE275|nr:ParB N-terminal domain-containing protein [Azorhizobium doebereinerae]
MTEARTSVKIALALIDTGERLRQVDPDRSLLIAASMKADGLRTPIEVRPAKKAGRYLLVVGGHRLDAATLLGWEEIAAYVLDLSADQARLREIDENLYRAELSELDRSVFLAERKRLHEKLHPATKHGGARPAEQVAIFGDLAPRFSADACEKLGVSERTLQRMIARAVIDPAVRKRISGTRLADKGSELDALVRLSPDEQAKAVDLILSGGDGAPRSVQAATDRLRGVRPTPAPSPDDAAWARLLKAWEDAPPRVQQRFLSHIGAVSQRDAA